MAKIWPRPNKNKKQPGAKNSYNDSKPWSKLQRDIYKLLDPSLGLQIQCRVTKTGMSNHDGLVDYDVNHWVTLGKGENQEILFHTQRCVEKDADIKHLYQKKKEVESLSQVIREYIETPREELFTKNFEGDKYGFINILRCADRRVGKRGKDKLLALILTDNISSQIKKSCEKILEMRFKTTEGENA